MTSHHAFKINRTRIFCLYSNMIISNDLLKEKRVSMRRVNNSKNHFTILSALKRIRRNTLFLKLKYSKSYIIIVQKTFRFKAQRWATKWFFQNESASVKRAKKHGSSKFGKVGIHVYNLSNHV